MSTNTTRTPAVPGVLQDPIGNRGVAFSQAERDRLGLTGRLPSAVLTLDQQALRAYQQLQRQPSDLAKNVYLEQLHDRNETLYYRVLSDHLAELLPVVYDPTVGDAIEKYSHEYRRPRGIFLSIDQPDEIAKAFATLELGPDDVRPDRLHRCRGDPRHRGLGSGRHPDRGKYRIFNDDMQGTGAITLAATLSAVKVTGVPMREQKLLVFGAGTAGVGIADQLHDAMVRDGATKEQATAQVWLVDKQGLLTSDMTGLRDYQQPYARNPEEVTGWAGSGGTISLLDAVRHVKPTILLGTSTAHGAFTQEVIETMSAGVERPIVFPISNPTSRIEAMPANVVTWSKGKALVAVGIPVAPVEYGGMTYQIGQANNALLYPGLGLGTIVSSATKVTAGMLLAAAEAVAGQVDVSAPGAPLVPPVENLRASSATTAVAVAQAAIDDGVATSKPGNLVQAVQDAMWQPAYSDA